MSNLRPLLSIAFVCVSLSGAHAFAQCLEWKPFTSPGVTGEVHDMLVFDDGSGPALFATGDFAAGGKAALRGVGKFDGTQWSALESGLTAGSGNALAVFDDGNGPALYVGGRYQAAGRVETNNIARWDGTSWSSVGSGLQANATIFDMEVFDNGAGPRLYVSTLAGIFRLEGNQWLQVADSLFGVMIVYDAGNGPALYVANVNQLSVLQAGLLVPVATFQGNSFGVGSLAVYRGDLIAAGNFDSVEGIPAANIARWNGTSWSPLGAGTDAAVLELEVFDLGAGRQLFVGGRFAQAGGQAADNAAVWNGTSWNSLGAGFDDEVTSAQLFDDGAGARLYLGGAFDVAGTLGVHHIASWDGTSFAALTRGQGPSATVRAMQTVQTRAGPRLFVGGLFRAVGTTPAEALASWDGTAWQALGDFTGLDTQAGQGAPKVLDILQSPAGGPVYVCGAFETVDGVFSKHIACYDDGVWTSLAGGTNEDVTSMAFYDSGSGEELYASGNFVNAGGASVSKIARWDGASWSPVGSNVPGPSFIKALAVYDDGGGEALFAGGHFFGVGGIPANHVARWDGANWSAVGTGFNDHVETLFVFDDGTGSALYAGGEFTTSGAGDPMSHVARWDGVQWQRLGSGVIGRVKALGAVRTSSDTFELLAGGDFHECVSGLVVGVAKWNGSSWRELDGSIAASGPSGFREALSFGHGLDGAGRPTAFVGGNMTILDQDTAASFLSMLDTGCTEGLGEAFCLGTPQDCPCSNAGAGDAGCNNAQGTGGARLEAVDYQSDGLGGGSARLIGDGLTALGTSFVLLRSSGQVSPVSLGDGLICLAGSNLVRLQTGISSACQTESLIQHSAAGPGTFYYQLWYRNTPSFCTPAAFNLSSGFSLTW